MDEAFSETIAALATPPGRGGIGIIRVSGHGVPDIARALLGRLPQPRQAVLHGFRDTDGSLIDQGIALYFPAPSSFTGEHVLELQGHGGPVVMDLLLAQVLELGARPARAGEFSQRAFLNDKLDLSQAEAVADLVDSGSAQAARAAMRSLQGVFSDQVHSLVERLIQLRMYVEAAIDFPEEEIDFLADERIEREIGELDDALATLLRSARQGCVLREGLTVVIAGRPNAGKSSLLNLLAGRDSAIVTDIPGTTRDVLRVYIQIDGMPLHVIDTAGLHESDDPVEMEGIRRAWREIEMADRVLFVVDDQKGWQADDEAIMNRLPENLPVTRIYSKIDITGRDPGPEGPDIPEIGLSSQTGSGLESLHAHLKNCAGYSDGEAGEFTARRRHLDALNRAHGHLQEGRRQIAIYQAGELLAEELRLSQMALGEITGEVSSDDLLGRIFSSFCIGK